MQKARMTEAAAMLSTAAAGEAPFYIPATDAPARPRRNLKHNDTFAVFDSHGDIGASAGGQDGLFDCDTRYLSHLELLDRRGPGRCCCTLPSTTTTSTIYVDLTNPDIYADGQIVLLKDTVHISRTIYLCDGLAARARRPHEPRRRAGQLLLRPSRSPATSPTSSRCAASSASAADGARARFCGPGDVRLSYRASTACCARRRCASSPSPPPCTRASPPTR